MIYQPLSAISFPLKTLFIDWYSMIDIDKVLLQACGRIIIQWTGCYDIF